VLDRIYPASVGERLLGSRQHIVHQSHEDVAVAEGRRPPATAAEVLGVDRHQRARARRVQLTTLHSSAISDLRARRKITQQV